MKFFLAALVLGMGLATPAVAQDAADCVRLRRILEDEAGIELSQRQRLEGVARFNGNCFERDMPRGIELLANAARADNPRAAIDLAVASLNYGTSEAAIAWRLMASIAVFNHREATPRSRSLLGNIPDFIGQDAMGLAWAFERKDVPALLARVQWLLARPPYMPNTEWRFVADITRMAKAEASFEAFYLFGIAMLEWRDQKNVDDGDRDLGFLSLQAAAFCGYPAAIRKMGIYLADGTLPPYLDLAVRWQVGWLNAQTGKEGALLERLNFPASAERSPDTRPGWSSAERDETMLRLRAESCWTRIEAARR